MNSKQRAYLRGLGNTMDPIFQVGKGGVSDEMLEQLDDALEARELIKVRVLKNCLEDPDEVFGKVAARLDAEPIQKIGRNFLIFRRSSKEPKIELPS